MSPRKNSADPAPSSQRVYAGYQPILIDTDFGGIADGKEDRSHDGVRTPDETDPLDPADDAECETDMDCGAADSGRICIMGACAPGCRGMDGNSCAEGERCTSVNGETGMCVPIVKPLFGGGGCKCGVALMERDGWPSAGIVLGALLYATRRRRRPHSPGGRRPGISGR